MSTTPDIGRPAPNLSVKLVGTQNFVLSDQKPPNFTLIVFYRGVHCPVCRGKLRQIHRMLGEFLDLGVEIVAVSMDSQERAQRSVDDWSLDGLRVGYGLSEVSARNWGLYLSTAIKPSEPDLFCEPGMFLVTPDGTLYSAAINSMPYARPDLNELRNGVKWILANDYPPRGQSLS